MGSYGSSYNQYPYSGYNAYNRPGSNYYPSSGSNYGGGGYGGGYGSGYFWNAGQKQNVNIFAVFVSSLLALAICFCLITV
jgi:hypothetical protein